MVPGFRITENAVADMAADIQEKLQDLDRSQAVVVLQLLHNSAYECLLLNGDKVRLGKKMGNFMPSTSLGS
jgi:hypothetical protein